MSEMLRARRSWGVAMVIGWLAAIVTFIVNPGDPFGWFVVGVLAGLAVAATIIWWPADGWRRP